MLVKLIEVRPLLLRDSGKTIVEHLGKADFVPMDFRNLTPANQKMVTDFIKTLPQAQQNQILIVR